MSPEVMSTMRGFWIGVGVATFFAILLLLLVAIGLGITQLLWSVSSAILG